MEGANKAHLNVPASEQQKDLSLRSLRSRSRCLAQTLADSGCDDLDRRGAALNIWILADNRPLQLYLPGPIIGRDETVLQTTML